MFFSDQFGSKMLHVLVILHNIDSSVRRDCFELVATNGIAKRGLNLGIHDVVHVLARCCFDRVVQLCGWVVVPSVDFLRYFCDVRRQLFNAVFYISRIFGVGCDVFRVRMLLENHDR